MSTEVISMSDVETAKVIQIGKNSPYVKVVLKNGKEYKSAADASKIKVLERICEMINGNLNK